VADSATILQILTQRFPGQVTALELAPAQTAVLVDAARILDFFAFLLENQDLKMNYLSSISGVDRTDHIEIVYFVSSFEYKHKLTVKTKVDRSGGKIDSLQHLIPAANWFEREIWELFGVDFVGHPDLRRFLLPDDWNQGNPMLRDWEGEDFVRMPEVQ
jgi:NADH-quinone oxidoreductase subunit C